MTADMLTGATIITASLTAWATAWALTRWTITHPTIITIVDNRINDMLAVAEAAGVLTPSIPRDDGVVLDHVLCEGGCGRTLCCCRPLHTSPRCEGTVAQVCGHLNPLCEGCAVAECDPCLSEATTDWFGGAR